MASYKWPPSGGAGSGVSSLNGETGDINIVGGTNVTVTPSGQNITISSSGIQSINADTTSAQTIVKASTGTDFTVSTTGGVTTLALPTASASNRGALSSADWSTFNAKQSALTIGNLTDAGTDGITIGNGSGSVIGTGTTISQHVADATHNGYLSSTDWSTFNGKGSGTVTSVAVATANGLAGSSSGGATPTLTISTSVSGIAKGNGTSFSTATAGTDYSAGTSALATGILKSTTTTGALTIATAGTDYVLPSGNTATSTTATNLAGGAGGSIPYQSAANTTAMLSNGTAGQGVQSQGGTSAPIWVSDVRTFNTQSGTTYTTVLSDGSQTGLQPVIYLTSSSAVTVTIPTNASVAYPVGAKIDLSQQGTGKVTIAAAGGVTITSKGGNLSIGAQYVGVQLIKSATNTWNLYGDLIA